jgi:hypothetical protein
MLCGVGLLNITAHRPLLSYEVCFLVPKHRAVQHHAVVSMRLHAGADLEQNA